MDTLATLSLCDSISDYIDHINQEIRCIRTDALCETNADPEERLRLIIYFTNEIRCLCEEKII